jgi:hypothetical protein
MWKLICTITGCSLNGEEQSVTGESAACMGCGSIQDRP